MAISKQALQTTNKFLVSPSNITEAMQYAKMICDSTFCPKDFKGKQGDVLIAMQMGAEVGLSPMQALQNIAVINGRPTMWGDAALAVVISHHAYVSHREWFTGDSLTGTLTAHCGITRRNSEEYVKSFSMEDAKKAGLWSKAGVWQQYPTRMLQQRARAFAIRDKFADALRGINIREEVEDYTIQSKVVQMPITKREVNVDAIDLVPITSEFTCDIDEMLLDVSQSESLKDLETMFKMHYKTCVASKDKDALAKLITAKNNKKDQLERDEFNNSYGEVEGVKNETTV